MRGPRILLLSILAGASFAGCGGEEDADPATLGAAGPAALRIGEAVWKVELATDPDTRRRGLGGRSELADGAGMLFAFPREEILQFHMLDCLIPLDVAFISSDLEVVWTRTMRVEDDPSDPQAHYSSKFAARYALEVPAGVLARRGGKRGDRVELLGAARNAAKAAR